MLNTIHTLFSNLIGMGKYNQIFSYCSYSFYAFSNFLIKLLQLCVKCTINKRH